MASHAARGEGPRRVRAGLYKLGVQGPLVEEYLDVFPDWIVQLCRARQKKFGSEPPGNEADKQRQARFLGYRGFTAAQIRSAVDIDPGIDSDHEEI